MTPSILPFLRPLSSPSRSTLVFLLKTFYSTTSAYSGTQQHVTERPSPPLKPTSSRKTSTRKPAVSSGPVTSSPPSIPPVNKPLAYHIHRTPSQQLPVYHLAKRGGNQLLTRLRKIDGDIMKLKLELQQALGLKQEEIAVNQLTKHIIIKGWRRNEVNQFLEARNF